VLAPSRKACAWIAAVWISCLIVGSLLPYRTKLALGTRPAHAANPRAPVVTLKHRAIHWLSFGGAALLLLLLARNRHQEIAAVAATIALGCFIEFAQHVMYRNDIEWWDMRHDTYGALAALVLLRFYRAQNNI
jgi:hypothetical protein